MSKKDTIEIDTTNSLYNTIFNKTIRELSDTLIDAENTSKEKYTLKGQFIKSANDMTTQEKLDAMDENYDCRNKERHQNIMNLFIRPLVITGILFACPIVVKKVNNFFIVA